jgi:hypothetical protein
VVAIATLGSASSNSAIGSATSSSASSRTTNFL